MALPQLSDEERRTALEKATKTRHARAELCAGLKKGDITFAEVMARSDEPLVARIKVLTLVESLPGYGKVRAIDTLKELNISENRRIQGLGKRQRSELVKRFGSGK